MQSACRRRGEKESTGERRGQNVVVAGQGGGRVKGKHQPTCRPTGVSFLSPTRGGRACGRWQLPKFTTMFPHFLGFFSTFCVDMTNWMLGRADLCGTAGRWPLSWQILFVNIGRCGVRGDARGSRC